MQPCRLLTLFALMWAPSAASGEVPANLLPLASRPFSAVISMPAVPVAGASGFQVPEEVQPGFLKGRFLVGFTTGRALPWDGNLESAWKISPFVRNTPRRAGWGPAFGLNWFKGDISVEIDGQRTRIGELKVRPVMAGVSYAVVRGRLITNFSFTGGYAFNRASITQTLPAGTTASLHIRNAWAVRPNVGLTYALTHRLVLVGSVGYVFTKPSITIDVDQAGRPRQSYTDAHRSDYVSANIGLAFSIF